MPSTILRTQVEYSGGADHVSMNVTHWMKNDTTPWTSEDIGDFHDAWFDVEDGGDGFHNNLATSWNLAFLRSTILSDPPLGPFTKTMGFAGTLTGDAAPPNVAIVTRIQTNTGGRSGRGRMYWPGFPESSITPAGRITGGNADGITANLQDVLSALATAGWHMVVYSRLNDEGHTIVGASTDTLVATQRRRLGR